MLFEKSKKHQERSSFVRNLLSASIRLEHANRSGKKEKLQCDLRGSFPIFNSTIISFSSEFDVHFLAKIFFTTNGFVTTENV